MSTPRVIETSYKYFGSDKKYLLVINDDLATEIRNNQTTTITIENIETPSQYFSALEQYVGDISSIAFPVCSGFESSYPEVVDFISSFYSNIYYVEGLTGNTLLDDYFEYSGVVCDGQSSIGAVSTEYRTGVNMLQKWASSYTSYESMLRTTFGFTMNPRNQYRNLTLYIPILKESDFDNGKFKAASANTYYSFIQINWQNSNRLTIMKYRNSSGSGTTLDYFNLFANTEIPDPPAPPPTDPYDPSHGGPGYSGTGGGPSSSGGTGTTGTGGLHDDSSDAIPTPSLPGNVATGSGLFTAYNPSASQLVSFASALWNMQVSDINDVLRFLFGGDAFNAVIGLHLLPVSPATSGSQSIKLGNWDTGVSAPKISSQYAQVSFGSILLPEYWGNCIDYAPYTKIQLALPYIGIVDVDTDDVLGSTNTLTYNIDVLSGAICATLHCVKFNLSSVIYQWSGACAVSLPFSGASYNSVLGAIAGIAAAGMGFASMAAGPIGAALPAAALAAGGGAFGAGSAASIMGTMKGKVQKSGSFGANSGALGIMTPYFILTRPVQSVPETWQADKGYPSNISAQLGTLTGYTEVSEINLECSGTEAEKNEIIDLLKKGVLF
jgi:hypothetical protein